MSVGLSQEVEKMSNKTVLIKKSRFFYKVEKKILIKKATFFIRTVLLDIFYLLPEYSILSGDHGILVVIVIVIIIVIVMPVTRILSRSTGVKSF